MKNEHIYEVSEEFQAFWETRCNEPHKTLMEKMQAWGAWQAALKHKEDNGVVFYKGKGEHSVSQLEEMVFKLKEKEHFINAPYAQKCLENTQFIVSNIGLDSNCVDKLRLVQSYFKGILGLK